VTSFDDPVQGLLTGCLLTGCLLTGESRLAAIPRRENSRQRGRFFPNRLCKLRARVEPAIGRRKRFKRVAMRGEKTGISYSAMISFAVG